MFAVISIYFFSVLEKLKSHCWKEKSQSSKYFLKTFLTHQILVLVKVSGISDGIGWNLWANDTDFSTSKGN